MAGRFEIETHDLPACLPSYGGETGGEGCR